MLKLSLLSLPLMLSGVASPALASPKMLGNPYGEQIDYSVVYNGKTYHRYLYGASILNELQEIPGDDGSWGIGFNTFEPNLITLSRDINFYVSSNVVTGTDIPGYGILCKESGPYINAIEGGCWCWFVNSPDTGQWFYYEFFYIDGNDTYLKWTFEDNGDGLKETGYEQIYSIGALSEYMSFYLRQVDTQEDFVFTHPRNIAETQPVVSNASLYDIVEDFYDNNLFNNEELENMTASVGDNKMSMRSWLSHTATIATLVVLFVAVFSLLFGIFRLFAHLSVNLFD